MQSCSARRSNSLGALVLFLAACLLVDSAVAFAPSFLGTAAGLRKGGMTGVSRRNAVALRMQETKEKKDVDAVTKKYGLEAGLFTAFTVDRTKDSNGPGPKELLAKYGSAYLVTSISLALVSFGMCYVLVDHGVDVAALLAKVGIESNGKTETAGTVAIAYAAHKAASPIRFPPTVALTPLTAKYLFNKKEDADEGQ